MKCLEKDRTRRYETANGLATDLKRHLNNEPVVARPPSSGVSAAKARAAKQGPVLAAHSAVAGLVGGIIGTTWGMIRAEQARQDAVSAELAEAERAEGERRAKEEAQKRLAQIEKATEILASVFRDFDPMAAEKEGVTLARAVRPAAGRSGAAAGRRGSGRSAGGGPTPARAGDFAARIGCILEQAEGVLVKACRTRERLLGADHLDTVATKHELAVLYRRRRSTPWPRPCTRRCWRPAPPSWGPTTPTPSPPSTIWPCCTSPTEVRPGRDTVQGGAGDPHRQAGRRPPRHPHQPEHHLPGCTAPRGRTPWPSAVPGSAGGPHRQAGGRPPRYRRDQGSIWPRCITRRGSTPWPSRCTRRWWRSALPSWGPTTPSPSPAGTPGLAVPMARGIRLGRAAVQGGAGRSHATLGLTTPTHSTASTTWPCCT